MPLPIIWPGDEITLLYRDGAVDGDPRIDCFVIGVHEYGYELQRADDPTSEPWSALLVEEERGLFRIVDVRPAPKPAMTADEIEERQT